MADLEMRAMVLTEPKPVAEKPLSLRDLPVPDPAAGQVRIRVKCCALCHTDLHTVEGDLPKHKRPVVPGHQVVGIVDAIGRGVNDRREGDRVGLPWLHWTDQTCEYCLRGTENLCEHALFTGYDVDGGYAEYVVAPADYVDPIPKAFDDVHAAPLLCAGIIGYRSYRLSAIQKGQRLGLYGFGASAHIVLQFAKHLGNEVYVFTRGEAHRALALKLGATWAGGSEDKAPELIDAAIIFAPLGSLVLDALRALRKGGTVALAGIVMSPIPPMDYNLIYHERVVRSVANSTRQDARELLELAAEVPVRTEVQTFALEQANEALLALKQSRIDGAGVLQIA
jgi:propanol-preferring alcohol dehydrogenase